MKILGIDSSGNVASVALMEDNIMVGEYTINNKKTHSQTLLPMLEAMLKMADTDVSELGAIAVAAGPGSFTGLRIGAATAKGLAGALNIPMIAVPTLEALAYNCSGWSGAICPLMDARRNQAYFGIYECIQDKIEVLEKQKAAPIEEIIQKINKLQKDTIFLGDGVPVFWNYILENVEVSFSFAPVQDNQQRAGSVAALGVNLWKKGEGIMKAAEFVPTYLRLSQAERERMEKEK